LGEPIDRIKSKKQRTAFVITRKGAIVVAAARILSQRHHDEEDDVRPPSPDALERGRRSGKLGARHGTRALNVAIRAISFATARKRTAQRLGDFENGLLHLFLAGTGPDQSHGLVTLRDLPLAMASRRRAFPSRREKAGPE